MTGGAFPGLAATYRGRDGAVELWEALRGPWDAQDLHIDVERIEDLGDIVLALLTMQASGESSRAPVTIKWAHVITFRRDDQGIHSFANWHEALKAVGLEE